MLGMWLAVWRRSVAWIAVILMHAPFDAWLFALGGSCTFCPSRALINKPSQAQRCEIGTLICFLAGNIFQ